MDTQRVASIAVMGFAAGVLLYRYGYLGLGYSGAMASVLTAVGGGGLVGGAAIGKNRGRAPWWVVFPTLAAVAAGAGGAFLLAPPLARLELHQQPLPGLSIGLPAGYEPQKLDYSTGKVQISRPGGFPAVLGVTWEPGPMLDGEDLSVASRSLALALSAKVEPAPRELAVGDGIVSRTVLLAKDGAPGRFTNFACGSRRIALFTVGDGSEKLHERILASVRCHPDPEQESATGEVPIELHLPEGWKAQPAEAGQQAYASADGASALMVRSLSGSVDADTVEKMLPALGTAMNGKISLSPRRTETGSQGARTLWSGKMSADSDELDVLVSTWSCPARGNTLLAIYFHPAGTDEAPGVALLVDARCK